MEIGNEELKARIDKGFERATQRFLQQDFEDTGKIKHRKIEKRRI